MTTEQYLAALKKLGLTRASHATAGALGLSVRQCIRIADGECSVPAPVAKLLRLVIREGIALDRIPDA
jgi:hypothetical protein